MKGNIIDWFLDRQSKIALVIGVVCIAATTLIDFRGFLQITSVFFLSLILIFAGQKLFSIQTSENWLKFSYGGILKNIFGGVIILFGWTIFLRGVFAFAIASMFLKKLASVIADRFDRTRHQSFFAKLEFFGRFGLFVDKRIAVFVVAREIFRRSVAANVAVDALTVNVKFAASYFRVICLRFLPFYLMVNGKR